MEHKSSLLCSQHVTLDRAVYRLTALSADWWHQIVILVQWNLSILATYGVTKNRPTYTGGELIENHISYIYIYTIIIKIESLFSTHIYRLPTIHYVLCSVCKK
jgi:hypothetical protein